jgi:hypothetical protein
MADLRPDLDGMRLHKPDSPDVWLVFHGRRHRVASPAVYDALWSEIDRLVQFEEADSVELGEELVDGTCLVRAEGTLPIYLLTVMGGEVRRFFIPTYEALLAYGFDEGKVRELPHLVLRAIPSGDELTAGGNA